MEKLSLVNGQKYGKIKVAHPQEFLMRNRENKLLRFKIKLYNKKKKLKLKNILQSYYYTPGSRSPPPVHKKNVIKSVKHTGLVRFSHWSEMFVTSRTLPAITRRIRYFC